MEAKEKFVKVKSVFAFLLVVMVVFSGKCVLSVLTASAAKVETEASGPNFLEIQRTPALPSGQIANVAQPQLVQAIYHTVLSLPARPVRQACPDYITAQFQLTFLHGGSSVLMATAQQGGCSLVKLRQGDVRVANSAFWVLLQNAGVLNNVHPAANVPGGLG